MILTNYNISMKKKLEKPGIKDINQGVSTGSQWFDTKGVETTSFSPIDGSPIAKVANATIGNYERLIKKAQEAYLEWRIVPAPKRGEVIRQIGEALLKRKDEPGYLVSLGMGKILEEGFVEVQKKGGKIVFSGGRY